MTENELIATLRLQRIPGIGPVQARKLIDLAGSPAAVFTDKRFLRRGFLPESLRNGLQDKQFEKAARAELDWMRKEGVSCLGYRCRGFPQNLKQCADAPIALFVRGTVDFGQGPLLAIVGTRDMTEYGRRFCQRFLEEIAPLKPIIVSGYAYGVDICAQRMALDLGLQTIACMAHGLDRVYPARHKRYCGPICRNGGLISEFQSGIQPEPGLFIRRNRIIAGLCRATVVVESGEKGGSLATADMAFGYDREVFAVPGRTEDLLSKGCNDLIRMQKAHLLQNAAQLARAMGWISEESELPARSFSLPPDLPPVDGEICRLLMESGELELDEIAACSGKSIPETAAALLRLEMGGLIRALAGKRYAVRRS